MKLVKKLVFLLLFIAVLLTFSTIETNSINAINLIAGEEDIGIPSNVDISELT